MSWTNQLRPLQNQLSCSVPIGPVLWFQHCCSFLCQIFWLSVTVSAKSILCIFCSTTDSDAYYLISYVTLTYTSICVKINCYLIYTYLVLLSHLGGEYSPGLCLGSPGISSGKSSLSTSPSSDEVTASPTDHPPPPPPWCTWWLMSLTWWLPARSPLWPLWATRTLFSAKLGYSEPGPPPSAPIHVRSITFRKDLKQGQIILENQDETYYIICIFCLLWYMINEMWNR